MQKSNRVQTARPSALLVAAGQDRFARPGGLGISEIHFKVAGQDSEELLVVENVFNAPGGPARHLHTAQDEWFMVLEGEFTFEVGDDSFRLQAGDSLFAPRRVPHVWAAMGHGRILIAFTPAGKMEAFFRRVTAANAMPPQDPDLWRAHDMELLGPPLMLPASG